VELGVVVQRYRAVLDVFEGAPVVEVARRNGVTRQTVHDWLRRYANDGGLGGLADRSSRPASCPHQMGAQLEAMIVAMRRAHPAWGPDRISWQLERNGVAFGGAKRPAVICFPLSRDRITTIGSGADAKDVKFPVTRDRLRGYRLAAKDAGVAWNDVVVAVCARNDAEEAARIAATLLSSPEPPDAIAAMSDQQAAGIVRAVRTAGRVIPHDVAVTGWDNAAVASTLGLTTVAQSLREQGAECARAVLGQKPKHLAAPWSVVRRSSTRL